MACSRCGENEAEKGQRYCPPCQAAYMRHYRATTRTIAERLALKEGHEAMRAAVMLAFANLGDRHFNGWTAQAIVREITIG